ncbi:MAG: tetratricopeptide repeat protein, partial [Leptospiraceae bacterium]|nr:tetratricopeptide repeat protein [Leptospiraceae bacterium]
MEPKKNRIRFENVETDPSITQYETDEYSTELKKDSSFLPWIAFIVLFLIVAGFGIWYQFLRGDSSTTKSKDEFSSKLGTIDKIFEKPYIPEGSLNPELAKCINLYKQNYIKKAENFCEEFLSSGASDKEKSIALTIIGVIYDAHYGRYAQAIQRLKLAIDYDPKNIYAYYNLALAFQHNGDPANARTVALRAKEIAPNDPRISLLAGNILHESNEPGEAIKIYKEGISQSPDDPYLIYNLALSQYKQGEMVEAMENFKKAIRVTGGVGQVSELSHGYLGTIFYHREDLDGAEHHFREAVALKPNNSKYLYNLGLILFKKGQREEAIRYFERAIETGTGDAQIYSYIAESFSSMNMYENAIASLERGLRVRPNDIDLMFQLAKLYYERGQYNQSEELYRKIIRSTNGDKNTEDALVSLGILLDEMERYSEAIETLNRAVALNSQNEEALFNLGVAYKHAGEPTKAIELWRKAQKLNPAEPRYQEAIGDFYYENGYYLEAAKEFEEIVRVKPHDHKYKLKLADAYYKMKNYDDAEKTLIQVLNQSKDTKELKKAHTKLAIVYAENGGKNKTKAINEAYRGSHIDPEDMESRLVLAKVLMDSGSLMDREKAIDELTAIVRSDVSPKIAAK